MDTREMAVMASQLKREIAPAVIAMMSRPDVNAAEAHTVLLAFLTDFLGHVLSFYDLKMREQLLETLVKNAKDNAREAGGSVGLIAQYVATAERE